MKRGVRIAGILAAVLLVGGALLLTLYDRPCLDGRVVKTPDSYELDIQRMNGTDRHTLALNAGDGLAVSFQTEEGTLRMELQAPDRSVLYSGNGKETAEFTVNIAESGSYTVTVEARSAKGSIHIRAGSR